MYKSNLVDRRPTRDLPLCQRTDRVGSGRNRSPQVTATKDAKTKDAKSAIIWVPFRV
jgi:hypothetical protein